MAVIRNYGAQGGVIAALEDRLPVGMGGFPPCEPRGFAAPRFYTLKSVDEATGVVTETPVLQCPTAADLAKLPEGRTVLIQILYANDKDEWNQIGQKYAKKNVEIMTDSTPYYPNDEETAQGYIVLPNDQLWMMARWVTQGADGNNLKGDWGLNEVGVISASPVYGVGRPLVTMAHDGAVAHVVSPCGTVWLDGVDTKQDEIWLAADKKKHSVTSKVGWESKPVTVKEDGTVWINSVQFFSESAAAVVDFTSYSGTYEDAKAFADADEAAMATAMATALGDGYHIIDVNPLTVAGGDMVVKSILLDAGGQSTTSELAWDSTINGGLYRQRIAVGDGVDLLYEGAVGCLCGNGIEQFGLSNSVIHYAICGDVSGFYADNATIGSVTCGDVSGDFNANSATIESVTCGDVSGYFSADYATIWSVTCGDVSGYFYANYSTIESVTCGDVGGDFNSNYSTIGSVTCGDVSGYFYANYATIESVSCGNVGGDFSADSATIESVSCGDVGNFIYNPASDVKVKLIKVGTSDVAAITNATVEEVIIGRANSGYDFTNSNFGKLTVTSTTVMRTTEPPASVDEILVPAPLVSMYKSDSLFSANFADKIKAM